MPQHRGRTYKNMDAIALEIMVTTGRNIICAYNLRKLELRNLTGINMVKCHQVYDVMALNT